MTELYVLSVWLHVTAAATWIGSMIFLAAVVVPTLRDPSLSASAPAALKALGKRYRRVGWISLAVLAVTGVANLFLRGLDWDTLTNPFFWSVGFGRTLAHKLALVGVVILMTVAHDLLMGRAATRKLLEAPGSEEARRVRRRASWLGRATLVASLAVLYFAVKLVRGLP